MNQFDRFTDIAHLPLAKMFTTHVFRQKATELEVDVIIEVRGLLSFFWSKIIAQKQIDGGVAQMNLLFEKAKQI
jgi:hypothetical protein